jgi:ribosome-binding protein aMBF1 (putative translation factor)
MKPKPPPTDFARAVREAREALVMSQATLASTIGVTPSTIYRVERGLTPSKNVEALLRRLVARKLERNLPEISHEAA